LRKKGSPSDIRGEAALFHGVAKSHGGDNNGNARAMAGLRLSLTRPPKPAEK